MSSPDYSAHSFRMLLANLPQNKKSGLAAGIAAKLQQHVHIGPKMRLAGPGNRQIDTFIIGMIPIFDIKRQQIDDLTAAAFTHRV